MPILLKKNKKDKNNQVTKKNTMGDDKSIVDKFLEIGNTSAGKQLLLGTSSGLVTGFICTRVGKVVAVAVGGGIILLQVAKENDYIKINWNKVNKKLDKIVDKVEEKVTGEGPSLVDKMERYVERKIDKMEDNIKMQQGKAKKWIGKQTGEKGFTLNESYIFLASFFAGVCVGMAVS